MRQTRRSEATKRAEIEALVTGRLARQRNALKANRYIIRWAFISQPPEVRTEEHGN